MNTTTEFKDEFAQIERWLTEAGLAYTVVAACPHPRCEVCVAAPISAAA